MKTNFLSILSVIVLGAVVTSCSTTKDSAFVKRKYMNGSYIEHTGIANKGNTPKSIQVEKLMSANVKTLEVNSASMINDELAIVKVDNTSDVVDSKVINSNNSTFDVVASTEKLLPTSKFELNKNKSVKALKIAKPNQTAASKVGLIILALFIPWLAVGIATKWKKPTLYNLLWTLLGYIPGIIHAIIVINREVR